MAVTADRVIVELEAKLDRYEANVRKAESRFDAATKSITADAKRMEREISASSGAIGSQFRAMAASVGAAFSVAQIGAMADSFTRYTNQLKVAGLEGAALSDVQERLFVIAQRNGTELETLGTLYSKAAQNQRELGASTDDLIQFNRAVAASLRVSGTSAQAAAGPLLQLGQALGSPRVMAEEFNSVLEGMPGLLREASKYIDGTGGSLSGLTRRIKDAQGPGVSNIELFRAITQAMGDLEAKAASTQLTLSGAFTALTNALTKYVGEADHANGASLAVTEALGALANNLETVTEAVGVLAAVMLGRFVAGMAAGAASSGVASAALFSLQARAVGAATTMEALAFTGRATGAALLGAFGGPIGLAVTALAVGIGYVATESAKAEAAAAELSASIDAQSAAFAGLIKKQDEADAAANRLNATQRAALVATANLTGEANLLANAWARVAAQAKAASIEQARAAAQTARSNRIAAQAAVDARADRERFEGLASGTMTGRILQATGAHRGRQPAASAKEKALLTRAQRNEAIANAELARVEKQKLAEFKPATSSAPASPSVGGARARKAGAASGGGSRGSSGPDSSEIARRFADDLARAEFEIRAAQADALGTAAARRDLERAQIAAQRAENEREIAANKEYSDAQKSRLLALNDEVAANRRAAVTAAELADGLQQSLDIRSAELADAQDTLRLQADLADSARERRAIELRILDLQKQEEKLRLQAIVASVTATEAEKEIARRRLAQLDSDYALRQRSAARGTEGPLERYRRGMNKTGAQVQEQAEQWVVDELEAIQSTLSNAIQKKIGVKDPILSGVIDLFIQQVIMRPLADAFAGASGGGGLFSALGSAVGGLFGAPTRASGGHVMAGKRYRVNELGIEGFQFPVSGKIIPLGRMRQASGGGVRVYQTVNVDASGSVNPDGYAEHIKAAVRNETAAIVGAGMRQVRDSVPARLAQYERDGR